MQSETKENDLSSCHYYFRTICRVFGAWRRYLAEEIEIQQQFDSAADQFYTNNSKRRFFTKTGNRIAVSEGFCRSNLLASCLRYRLLCRRAMSTLKERINERRNQMINNATAVGLPKSYKDVSLMRELEIQLYEHQVMIRRAQRFLTTLRQRTSHRRVFAVSRKNYYFGNILEGSFRRWKHVRDIICRGRDDLIQVKMKMLLFKKMQCLGE
jgi:signal recognition particle GTPase